MKVTVIGAGRMGLRHATGALQAKGIEELVMIDISEAALENAEKQLNGVNPSCATRYLKPSDCKDLRSQFVIIASTAGDRIKTCDLAMEFEPEYLLVEKPLGQSYEAVEELVEYFSGSGVKVSVNLNMRMYDFVNTLKYDLDHLPQFSGLKYINVTGGTLGIGANGIHYLDLLFYLYGAASAELVSGEIDEQIIPSGRGAAFGDFGGWACIKFFDGDQQLLGRSLVSLSATSTVFGGWDMIGSHGRIRLNETENERIDILRTPASEMPINRYAADYLPPVVTKIETPFLGDLTKNWIDSIANGNVNLLPSLAESLKVHKLMFDWLSLSATHQSVFPIT
jgi:predicted dehydrogenase